jgi:hypothetical protein
MTRLSPEEKMFVDRYAESLMTSEGVSTPMQRFLIQLAMAVFRCRLELSPIYSVELIGIARKKQIRLSPTNLEDLINRRLPEVFQARSIIDLGPVGIKREIRSHGDFYTFWSNPEALEKISDLEDHLLDISYRRTLSPIDEEGGAIE